MPKFKAIVIAGALLTLTPFTVQPAKAQLPNYEQIYIFGDSLSDTGNLFNLSSSLTPPNPFPPSPFYTGGRFTNGTTWIEYLDDALGLQPGLYTELDPLNPVIPTDGINFAFGGATTGEANIAPFAPGVLGQIDLYTELLDINGGLTNSNALYVVWAGANDYLFDLILNPNNPSPLPPPPAEIPVDNIVLAIETLASRGARNFLVPNLGELGKLPLLNNRSPELIELYNTLTTSHNMLLAQRLNDLRQTFVGINLISLDIAQLFQNLEANPGELGFTNITSNCTGINFPFINPAQDTAGYLNCISSNPDNFFFWDNYHPTAAGHQTIADAAIDTLSATVPEPSMIPAISLLGLWMLGKMVHKQSC